LIQANQNAAAITTQTGLTNQCLKDQGLLSVKELCEASLPAYGPVILSNCPVQTRMPGCVVVGEEKPPATRLAALPFRELIGLTVNNYQIS
jgi:hypothetical protein